MEQTWKNILYSKYVTTGQSGIIKSAVNLKTSDLYDMSIIKKILPEISHSDRIVDLGCGYGSFLFLLKSLGFKNLTGVEVSVEQVQVAKSLGLNNEIIETDIFNYFKIDEKKTVKVFVLKDVIEHLKREEIFDLFDKINQRIDPKGIVVIHVPNASGIFGMTIRYGDLTHELAFTPKSIRQLLNTFDYKKIEITEDKPIIHGMFSFFRYLIWQILTLPFRLLFLAETGLPKVILSQNFTIIARK